MNGSRWWTLAAGGLMLIACGDGGDSVSPASSSESKSSVVVPTTGEVTPTTSSVALVAWSRPCTDYVRGTAAQTVVDEAALDTFGPLALEPGLTIELPMVNASFNYPVPSATRIPGGVLVAATTDRTGYPAGGSMAPAGTVVAAIDDDGGVRWVRCLDRTASVGLLGSTNSVVVNYLDWENYEGDEAHLISLADGTIDAAVVTIPDVPALDHPTWAFASGNETLQYLAADGTVKWADESYAHFGGEAWNLDAAGGVVVAAGCPVGEIDGSSDYGCRAPSLRGYRAGDGRKLWERPGQYWTSLAGDGFALVATNENWVMIDARTGEDVRGQVWDRDPGLAQGCCADMQTWARRFGGVVIASTGNTVRVYFPIDAGVASHAVTLP